VINLLRCVLIAGLVLGAPARAACVDYPTPEEEFGRSVYVFSGRVTSHRDNWHPPKGFDPGMEYVVAVKEIFRGDPPKRIKLFTERNSGQFPMEVGASYLLYVREYGGLYSVYNCGHSGKLTDRASLVQSLRQSTRR
jgi:hypothetical protein